MSDHQFSPLPTVFKRIDKALAMPGRARKSLYVLWILIQDMIRCDLGKQASAMAYVTLLSLIPSLVAIFCVISLFSPMVGKGTGLVDQLRGFMLENLAAGSGQVVVAKLDEMLRSLSLSKIGWSSFAGVLVTLILLLRQIEEALNRIWFVRKGRNVFSRFMYFWTFLTLGMLVIALIFGATAGKISHFLNFGAAVPKDNGLLSGIVAWFGGFLFFFFMYKVVPNCFVRARDASVGATVSSLVLLQGGRVYAIFVKGATNYQTLYGALAALPLFLMWLYICWLIILFGAVIAWRMEQGFPTAVDDESLDKVQSPLEQLRNSQVQAMLPLVTMLAIYKNFTDATGKGVTAHALAAKLKLPLAWICDSLEALQELGYVVAARATGEGVLQGQGGSHVDAFFPSFPSSSVQLNKLQTDLASPIEGWLSHWHHDLPIDLTKALHMFSGPDRASFSHLSLHDAMSQI